MLTIKKKKLTCVTKAFVSGVVLSSNTFLNSLGLETLNSEAVAIN